MASRRFSEDFTRIRRRVNRLSAGALLDPGAHNRDYARVRTLKEKEMSKLLSLIVAAMFVAVSGSALAAAHAGAGDKKMDKKEGKMEKKEKKAAKKKTDKMEKKADKK